MSTETDRVLNRIDAAIGIYTATDYGVSDDAMRQAPQPVDDPQVIDTDSRSDAIADGRLVEVPEHLAREAGFRVPVALTRAAWEDCVAWTDDDTERTGVIQDETGRLWDVLWMARLAVTRNRDRSSATVRLVRVPRNGRGDEPQPVTLAAAIGPGDDGEPVITIMHRGED